MNYVSVEVLRHAAAVMDAVDRAPEEANAVLRCDWQEAPDVPTCGEPATHLVADATRVSAGGDIEAAPQWFCREHLELEMGEPVREQPIFRRLEGPEFDPEV